MTFLTLTLAQVLGSFIGNFLLLLTVGFMLRYNENRKQKQYATELIRLRKEFLDAVDKENARMAKYVELEGLPSKD